VGIVLAARHGVIQHGIIGAASGVPRRRHRPRIAAPESLESRQTYQNAAPRLHSQLRIHPAGQREPACVKKGAEIIADFRKLAFYCINICDFPFRNFSHL